MDFAAQRKVFYVRQYLRLGREGEQWGELQALEIAIRNTQKSDWQPGRCPRGTSLANRVIGEGSPRLSTRRKEFYRPGKEENRNPNSAVVGLGSAYCHQKKVDLSNITS
jgi:hypothetical protein